MSETNRGQTTSNAPPEVATCKCPDARRVTREAARCNCPDGESWVFLLAGDYRGQSFGRDQWWRMQGGKLTGQHHEPAIGRSNPSCEKCGVGLGMPPRAALAALPSDRMGAALEWLAWMIAALLACPDDRCDGKDKPAREGCRTCWVQAALAAVGAKPELNADGSTTQVVECVPSEAVRGTFLGKLLCFIGERPRCDGELNAAELSGLELELTDIGLIGLDEDDLWKLTDEGRVILAALAAAGAEPPPLAETIRAEIERRGPLDWDEFFAASRERFRHSPDAPVPDHTADQAREDEILDQWEGTIQKTAGNAWVAESRTGEYYVERTWRELARSFIAAQSALAAAQVVKNSTQTAEALDEHPEPWWEC